MILELFERRQREFARDDLPREAGYLLVECFGDKIDVEEPTFRTRDMWRLTPKDWVGYIPLLPDFGVALRPKAPIGNLLRMLEYAYDLESFEILHGHYDSATLEEFYERLAGVLARMVLRRGQRGFARRYERESDRLSYVRGRMDVERAVRAPWDTKTLCHYEEHTADTEENRILAWTLFVIARSGLCSERVLPDVRHAYRQLVSLVTLHPVPTRACVGRHYDRLTDDYRPMHALCRFFLENSGPSHEAGDRRMLPFLVNMARLFELFVARWLEKNLPPGLRVESQETLAISREAGLSLTFDLVVYDAATGDALAVLDTKYKVHDAVSNSDFYQIVTYAKATGCRLAYLLYPVPLRQSLDYRFEGGTRVRALPFSLAGDLEQAGRDLVDTLVTDLGTGADRHDG